VWVGGGVRRRLGGRGGGHEVFESAKRCRRQQNIKKTATRTRPNASDRDVEAEQSARWEEIKENGREGKAWTGKRGHVPPGSLTHHSAPPTLSPGAVWRSTLTRELIRAGRERRKQDQHVNRRRQAPVMPWIVSVGRILIEFRIMAGDSLAGKWCYRKVVSARRRRRRHAALQVDRAKKSRSESCHRRSVAARPWPQYSILRASGARRDRGPGRWAGSWLSFILPASRALGLNKPNRFDRRSF
jgi:hypothetical protein